MDELQRASEQQHFIEEIGLFFEQRGVPRMAGRILGHLLICDPPQQSMDELATALQASKGSISTMTRLLIQLSLVERVALPGHRRDYFRIKAGAWTQALAGAISLLSGFRALADRGIRLVEDQPPEQRQRLQEMRDLYAFFEREFPRLLEQWEQERKGVSP